MKPETVEKIAGKLGFEYTAGKWNAFTWYERYGFHSKDNIFDRFEPQTTSAEVLKMLAQTIWFLTYIVPFGLWLTVIGQILRSWYTWIKDVLGFKQQKVERRRIA